MPEALPLTHTVKALSLGLNAVLLLAINICIREAPSSTKAPEKVQEAAIDKGNDLSREAPKRQTPPFLEKTCDEKDIDKANITWQQTKKIAKNWNCWRLLTQALCS
ncbi:hypothetical protein Bbelb_338020 [Branchiostoma belcheri]|nr:hypothetical protein Bbelb_338020 [Branchiostoma belcheri]